MDVNACPRSYCRHTQTRNRGSENNLVVLLIKYTNSYIQTDKSRAPMSPVCVHKRQICYEEMLKKQNVSKSWLEAIAFNPVKDCFTKLNSYYTQQVYHLIVSFYAKSLCFKLCKTQHSL